MTDIQHHAVIATTWNPNSFHEITEWYYRLDARRRSLFLLGLGLANGYRTIVLIPAGSKVGWDTQQEHLKLSEDFISQLEEIGYFTYVQVSFGDQGSSIEKENK